MESKTVRLPEDVIKAILKAQKPRETMGDTLRRLLAKK